MRISHSQRIARIRRALLEWFRAGHRHLPGRGKRNPYEIWVAEVMLQQTRVEAVKPYYRRFLRRFPTVRELAAAALDDVLKAWEGMGYYSRARNLHAAARQVVDRHAGRLPETADALRELPGIGPYTAGAIASIAFGRPEPVLDGNVARVLCRVFLIAEPPAEPATRARLWKLAGRLVPADAPGDFNQALMELGATVCLPRSPRCEQCPTQDVCRARAAGRERSLPRKSPKPELPHQDIVAAIVRKRGRVLIDRRPADGLLGGLWEFPGGKVETDAAGRRESFVDAVCREVREEVGIEIEPVEPFVTVEHAYTHFRITLHTFLCRHLAGRARAIECDEVRWVRPDELDDYAFPRANRRIIDALRERDGRPEGRQQGGRPARRKRRG